MSRINQSVVCLGMALLWTWLWGAVTNAESRQFRFEQRINETKIYYPVLPVNNPFAGGLAYSYPVLVDIDADGDPDLFMGESEGTLLFFRNHSTPGSIQFLLEDERFLLVDIGDFSAPAFADIDADGDYDLFLGNEAGDVIFFLNSGSAALPAFAFQTKKLVPFPGRRSTPRLIDIDGDADLDLFVGGEDGRIYFYRNTGTAAAPQFQLVSERYADIDAGTFSVPVFADIDADGDFDLLIGLETGRPEFYRNKGKADAPLFERQKGDFGLMDFGSYAVPAFADIDGDGDLELFAGERDGNLNFLPNIGSALEPNLQLETESLVMLDLGRLSVPVFADIDADGDQDLFVGESDGELYHFVNTGNPAAPEFRLISSNYLGGDVGENITPVFADLDADGDLDLLLGEQSGKVLYFRNDGTPAVAAFVPAGDSLIASVDRNSRPALADLDADGDFDLVVGWENGTLSFYRNIGSPTAFQFQLEYRQFAQIDVGSNNNPFLVDFDLDGDFDLLIGENSGDINFFPNRGTRSHPVFDAQGQKLSQLDIGRRGSPAAVDIDSNGTPDLLIGEEEGGLFFFLNRTVYTPVSVREPTAADAGSAIRLRNFPNPFNASTIIEFDLPAAESVRLQIYNTAGQEVAALLDETLQPGLYRVQWNGADARGAALSSGIYYARLGVGAKSHSIKLIILR